LQCQLEDNKWREVVFFEQEIKDEDMDKRDVFMTLPKIIQAYFLTPYFEQGQEKPGKWGSINTMSTKIKNEIKFSYVQDKPAKGKPFIMLS
jgi:hypothetical protein